MTTQAQVPSVTYDTAVRTFDHGRLAAIPAYARLRQALSDLGNEIAEHGGMKLPEFLDVVRDMALTAPFGDMCAPCNKECARTHHDEEDVYPRPCGAYRLYWPHAAERKGDYIVGAYQCARGHTWPCTYAVCIVGMF